MNPTHIRGVGHVAVCYLYFPFGLISQSRFKAVSVAPVGDYTFWQFNRSTYPS